MSRGRTENQSLSLFCSAPYGWRHPLKILRWHLGTLRCVVQRARHGYCYRDLWSMGEFYLGLFSKMPKELAEITDGYPYDMATFDDWTRYLREMAGCFEYCADNYDSVPKDAKEWPQWRQLLDEQLQEGMSMLQVRFWNL